jgi:AAA+ superfamily predicted ATPase
MSDQRRFDDITELPNPNFQIRYESLIGLNDIKERLAKEAEILLNPGLLEEWSIKQHNKVIPIIKQFDNRHSLFIFAGDVGTGKTALAETFGDFIARKNKKSVLLYRLSLNTRGQGAVGEMTRLISTAFQDITDYAEKIIKSNGNYSSACILLIDEADALAQSREFDHMHHEDRAGVNALIRGVDSITEKRRRDQRKFIGQFPLLHKWW